MFSKIKVNGEEAHPLYRYLTSDELPVTPRGEIKWNFEKFLVGRDGEVRKRFRSEAKPTSEQMIAEIEEALSAGQRQTD
jgi:glutathione peroxidase